MPTPSAPTDEVVEDKGVKILVDPKAVLFLLGTEMDYKTEKLVGAVHLQQSEPDRRLRLRRIGAADAGQGRGGVSGSGDLRRGRPPCTSGSVSHITRLRPWRLAA